MNIGNAGFSAGEVWFTSLAFSPIGQPYVAYEDGANSQMATVMKYDSVYWGVSELQASRLSLYPNPATDKITVEISGTAEGSNLSVLNIKGQQLITRQITEPKTQLDISCLPQGVYVVKLTNPKSVATTKLIKQ